MSFTLLLEDWWADKGKGIQTGMVGKIVSFDDTTLRASVQPLYKTKEENTEKTYPILSKIPCTYLKLSDEIYFKPSYKTNDLVWIGFSTFSMEKALLGQSVLESERIFGLENACILGHVTPDTFVKPDGVISADGAKFVIKNNDQDMKTLLNDLADILKEFTTFGSPATHATDPATIIKLTAWSVKVGQLYSDGT